MLCHEPWAFEFEAFDGGWSLADCNHSAGDDAIALCLARMLVLRVVADAVRRQVRAEDLSDDVAETRAYVAGLRLAPHHARSLDRLLAALTPFDPEAIAEQLMRGCAAACAGGQEGGARGLAELAYETAVVYRLDASAQGAAFALAHLATLQEAPWNARKWRAIARVHGQRFARARFACA